MGVNLNDYFRTSMKAVQPCKFSPAIASNEGYPPFIDNLNWNLKSMHGPERCIKTRVLEGRDSILLQEVVPGIARNNLSNKMKM